MFPLFKQQNHWFKCKAVYSVRKTVLYRHLK